jgi:hypothetical protein
VEVDHAELADRTQNFGDNDDDDQEDDDFDREVDHMEAMDQGGPHEAVDHAPPVEDLEVSVDHIGGSPSIGDGSLNGVVTPASSNANDGSAPSNEPTERQSGVVPTNGENANTAGLEHPDTKLAEVQTQTDMSVVRLIQEADHSAGKLVNLLAKHFPCFQDQGRFEGRKVRFLKRAQILVADLWAAFNNASYGEFYDIGHITMFAGESPLWNDFAARRVIVTPGSRLPGTPNAVQPRRYHILSTVGESAAQEGRAQVRRELRDGTAWIQYLGGGDA